MTKPSRQKQPSTQGRYAQCFPVALALTQKFLSENKNLRLGLMSEASLFLEAFFTPKPTVTPFFK